MNEGKSIINGSSGIYATHEFPKSLINLMHYS